MTTSKLHAAVLAELTELHRLGVRVPSKAFALLDQEDLDEYDNMSASEIADLLISLSLA
jgi:hypothetical protein